MPVTTISKITLDQGDGGPSSNVFYPKDITIVLSQPDVIAVKCFNAMAGNPPKPGRVLVGVTDIVYAADGKTIVSTVNLVGPNNFAAMGCPPYNDQGGEYVTEP